MLSVAFSREMVCAVWRWLWRAVGRPFALSEAICNLTVCAVCSNL